MLSVALTSVVALTSSYAAPHYVHLSIYLGALGMVLAVIAAITGDETFLGLGAIVQVGLLAAAMAAVLIRVVSTAEVGARTILGAISVYTVLGLLFAFIYEAIGRIQSSPFFEGHAAHPPRRLPLLQLHDADHDRVRGPRPRRSARPHAGGLRDADRPDLPGHPGRRAGQPLATG